MHLKFSLLKNLTAFALTMISFMVNAQSNYFEPASSGQMRTAAPIAGTIQKYSLYRLTIAELRSYLAKAPLEFQPNTTPLRLDIPLPNGTVETFAIRESPILAPAVAAAHPDIKTYTGTGQFHRTYTIRLSFTGNGFDAIILGVESDAVYYTKVLEDPTDRLYLTYFARDAKKAEVIKPFGSSGKCGSIAPALEELLNSPDKQARVGTALNNTGTVLRTFRLAVAATGEFTQRKGGGTVSGAFNALVAYVNRMNAVYRVELSVAFTLVSGTNVVYADANTDPYTNTDQVKMLTENHNNLTTVIGAANYDVGHVFSYEGGSGGGIAAASSVCVDENKGKGVSGMGDPAQFAPIFDDQLVSHEVGHQFGMSHTFNSSLPVCTTREATTSVEPGAGTTIMSYGYTCSNTTGNDNYETPTYQPFLNFHTVSYQQAATYISTLTCFTATALNNAVPVIGVFPANTTIPKSTPFELTGTATDANAGDVLNYSWEGTNIGTIVPDAATLANTALPPFFRSYAPVSAGTRTFPRLSAILDGSNYAKGDKLPSVGIATTLRMTVRDNAGGLTYQAVTVTVDGNSGPFLETTNLTGSFQGNSLKTITWNVANTTAPPVNCANVTILLSTDGGLTFPTTLLANTPNDGTEDVTFPMLTTNLARIKIVSTNNVFFDISNSNFTIVDPNNQPPVASVITNQTGVIDAPFSFVVPAFNDPENQTLSYTASGLPASLSFNSATRTISGTPTALGVSTITITAADPASATASASFMLTINPAPAIPLIVNLTASATTILTTGSTTLTAIVSGGRPPYAYNYSLNSSLAAISSTGNQVTLSDVTAGVQTFTVIVTDATLPTSQTTASTITVTVTAPGSSPVVKVNSNDPSAAEGRPATVQQSITMRAKNSVSANAADESVEDFGYIQFERSNTVGPLVINYQIGGSATNGVDFDALPTSITFADGQSVYTEIVDPIDDDIVEGDETIIITLIDTESYDPDPNQITTTVTLKDNDTPVTPNPASLTITSFTCNSATNGALNRVDFVVGYSNGSFSPTVPPLFINGVTGNGSLGVTYSLPFDQNVNTLTVQDQATRSTYFVWNFRQACTTTPQPPIPPVVPPLPTSLTITSFTCNSPNSVLSSVDFVVGYNNGGFSPAVAPIFINGVTGNGALGVRYSLPFDQNVSTLTVQDQASRSTYFMWNFRQACAVTPTPPVIPPNPTSLTITSFTCNGSTNATLSRVDFVVGYKNGSFTPAVAPLFINGVTGNGSLGVTYSLPFDQNVNTLTVQDQATRSTYFVWDFRQACTNTTARISVEGSAPWQVIVQGNPTNGEVVVLIEGAQRETLNLEMLDLTGRTVTSRQIQPISAQHREVFTIANEPAGLLLLRVTGNVHSQTVKVMKQ